MAQAATVNGIPPERPVTWRSGVLTEARAWPEDQTVLRLACASFSVAADALGSRMPLGRRGVAHPGIAGHTSERPPDAEPARPGRAAPGGSALATRAQPQRG